MEQRFAQLETGRLHLVDQKIARMTACIPTSHEPADLLESHYWAHEARRMMPNIGKPDGHTIITAIWEDRSKYMELLVVDAGSNYAIVRQLTLVNLAEDSEPKSGSTYEAKWLNKTEKFGVMRIGDQSIMRANFHSKADAEKYITELE